MLRFFFINFQPQIIDSLFAIAIFFVCLIILLVGYNPSNPDIQKLLMQQQFKTHYTLASEALRRYLCGMYKVEALDQTTEELRIELIHVPITSTHARHAIGILRDCDLVKFARLVPDEKAAQELLNDIHNLVILTQPIKQSESNITNAKIVEEEIS